MKGQHESQGGRCDLHKNEKPPGTAGRNFMPSTVILSKAAGITLSNLPSKYLCLYPEVWLLSTME